MDNGQWIILATAGPTVVRSFSTLHYPLSIVLHEAAEVGEDAQPQLLAFLRMKLTGKQALGGDAGDEGVAVIRGRRNDRAVVRYDVKGVHEVNVIAARQPVEKRRVDFLLDPIPTHVRHFEIFLGVKTDHF